MGSIRVRKNNCKLFIDFRFQGKRCREQTLLEDTPANQRKLEQLLRRIEAEITLGSFDYQKYFPNSAIAKKFALHKKLSDQNGNTPLFQDFAKTWLGEMKIQWRASQYDTVDNVLSKHLIPTFTETEVGTISKADILSFRASLAKIPGHGGSGLSPSRINHIMTPLRMILREAADRYDFNTPYRGIQ